MPAVNGFVAVTDTGWFQRLAARPGPQEVNFWRPSVRPVPFDRLARGTPFLFKLKVPYNAIAGFGYFISFTVLPDWLAWDTFQEGNGVASLGELRQRLSRIQAGARITADPLHRIGCCLIAEARFFARGDWIKQPADWGRTTQVGATYDLTVGEGLRIWTECQLRVAAAQPRAPTPWSNPSRYGAPATYLPRLGQGIFRVQVLDAYGRACAVTQEHSLPVLEAAHIRPYAQDGPHAVSNGLTLRTDLHRLFDRGYATVDQQHRFVVSTRLKDDYHNGRSYYGLQGRQLTLPADRSLWPDPNALAWHREKVFLV